MLMMKTSTMIASRCPFTTMIIISNIIIITSSIIPPPPSVSFHTLRHRTRREGDHVVEGTQVSRENASENSQHDLVSFDDEFFNSIIINTSVANNNSDDDDDDDVNTSASKDSRNNPYNSLNFTSEYVAILKVLIREFNKYKFSDDFYYRGGGDDDHFDCYRLTSVLVKEENMKDQSGDDDDDVIVDTNKTTMTFKLVVKRYHSMKHHHHNHRQQKQQLSGSHGNGRPLKFCLPRDRATQSNGNTEKNSEEKINYDNEDDQIEANQSDHLRTDTSIELDRTPSRSARTQTVVITTSSVVITAFFFTAIFLRIRNHVKRYRNSARHKSAMRLHATKELHNNKNKSKKRNFTKFLTILTTGSWGDDNNSQSLDRLQKTQLEPIQSESRNLKMYNSRSDVEEVDDDVIYPDVDFQDGRLKQDELNMRMHHHQDNKSVRFAFNDQRLPVLRSHSYNPVSLTTEEGDGIRRWRPRDDKPRKKGGKRKFSFQGRHDNNRNDLMKMSRFKSNKSKREMLHRCLEQLNSSNLNEASYQ